MRQRLLVGATERAAVFPDQVSAPRACDPARPVGLRHESLLACPRSGGRLRVIATVQDPLAGPLGAPAPPGPAPPAPAALR